MTPAELEYLRWLHQAFVLRHSGAPDRDTDYVVETMEQVGKDLHLGTFYPGLITEVKHRGRHGISVSQIQEIAEAEARADIGRTLSLDSNLVTWLLAKVRVGPPIETRELENEAVEWFVHQGESWKGLDEIGQEIELALDALRDGGLISSDGSFWQAV